MTEALLIALISTLAGGITVQLIKSMFDLFFKIADYRQKAFNNKIEMYVNLNNMYPQAYQMAIEERGVPFEFISCIDNAMLLAKPPLFEKLIVLREFAFKALAIKFQEIFKECQVLMHQELVKASKRARTPYIPDPKQPPEQHK
mgnify:CR=1 FL=1